MANKEEVSLAMLEDFLPTRVQTLLQSALKPSLGGDAARPPRQELEAFWLRVERVIQGLGTEVRLDVLRAPHIATLAPFVLGQAVYELY